MKFIHHSALNTLNMTQVGKITMVTVCIFDFRMFPFTLPGDRYNIYYWFYISFKWIWAKTNTLTSWLTVNFFFFGSILRVFRLLEKLNEFMHKNQINFSIIFQVFEMIYLSWIYCDCLRVFHLFFLWSSLFAGFFFNNIPNVVLYKTSWCQSQQWL